MKNVIRKVGLIAMAFFFVIMIVAACGGDSEEPEVEEETESMVPQVPVPTEGFPCPPISGLGRFNVSVDLLQQIRESFLPIVPSQIIITAPPDDLNILVADPRFDELGLQSEFDPIELPPLVDEPLLTNLYFYPDQQDNTGDDVVAAIQTVYNIAAFDADGNKRDEPLAVLAHPNNLVGSPLGIDADPLGIDADPLGIDADPLGIDADPATGNPNAITIPGESIESVWRQWALTGEHSINLYTIINNVWSRHTDIGENYGDEVDIYVFDTSPFTMPTDQNLLTTDIMGRQLCVYHPDLVVEIESGDSQVKQHGYFSTGLIRFVAPNGRFHLIRILNNRGIGDVFSFIVVLNELIEEKGDMSNSIINLSLSLREFEGDDAELFAIDDEAKRILHDNLPITYTNYISNTDVIPAVMLLMQQAYEQGAVIVSAAGNDSDMTLSDKNFIMGIPASLPTTVGVSGSNINGDRACFANKVEMETQCLASLSQTENASGCAAIPGLQAPSGDGEDGVNSCDYPFPKPPPTPSCPPSQSGWYDCIYGVSSVVISDTGDVGYAHWVGTSFATPLVSGTAALMLQASDSTCSNIEITTYLREYPGVLSVPDAVMYARSGCP